MFHKIMSFMGRSTVHPTERAGLKQPGSPAERRQVLFQLLDDAMSAGARVVQVRQLDDMVVNRHAALVLKHDVHGLNLASLLAFARAEADMGILGSYFFMPPDHPDTARHYGFSEQVGVMREIQAMGHEIGLHLDPYFMMEFWRAPLRDVLLRALSAFEQAGISVNSMNMHGNSAHQHKDANGYGTSFDLFEELARQPDYPELKAVDPDSAEVLRTQRVRLADFGINFWADMPLWSRQHGYVVTNFVSDNQMGRTGKVEVLTHKRNANSYDLVAVQRPGSRNRAEGGTRISCGTASPDFEEIRSTFPVESDSLVRLFSSASTLLLPAQFLVHPQFYI